MNRLFTARDSGFFKVPDGTLVNPFLDPTDGMSGLPCELVDGPSVAAGQVNPGVVSEIHVMPFVSQITVLLSGKLVIRMMEPQAGDPPYEIDLELPKGGLGPGFAAAAVITPPGTLFQLDNASGSEPARVLYVVTPSYVFEPGPAGEPPVYDDAITLGNDWAALGDSEKVTTALADPTRSRTARHAALQRITERSRPTP